MFLALPFRLLDAAYGEGWIQFSIARGARADAPPLSRATSPSLLSSACIVVALAMGDLADDMNEVFSLQSSVFRAIDMLAERTDPERSAPDVMIPPWVLQQAEGIVFMWTYKVRVASRPNPLFSVRGDADSPTPLPLRRR